MLNLLPTCVFSQTCVTTYSIFSEGNIKTLAIALHQIEVNGFEKAQTDFIFMIPAQQTQD